MPKRIVVTGGAGFLGSHICVRLLELGHHVTCVDNLITGSNDNVSWITDRRFSFARWDVSGDLHIPGNTDAVLHFASPASPRDYHRFPIETLKVGSIGTLNVLEFALKERARFLLASTSEVYGDPLEHPQKETYWGNVNPIGPRAVYDESKRFAEAATSSYRREYGLGSSIVRIFNTYGPRMRVDDGRLVPTLISQALRGERLTVTGRGDQTRSLCYVDDLVDGIVRLLESGRPGPVNLGNPHEESVLDIAHRIRRLTGCTSPVTHIELPEDDPMRRRPDITAAQRDLGWSPRTGLDDGLRKTIEWFRGALTRTQPDPRP